MSRGTSIVGSDPKNREKNDFYPSPPHTIHDLMRVDNNWGKLCWEPACGQGHMSRELEKYFSSVLSTDLVSRGYGTGGVDFLSNVGYFGQKYDSCPDAVITNPPYSHAIEFLRTALGVVDPDTGKVAMLLKLVFLESVDRYDFFKNNPPMKVWVYSRRLRITRGGRAMKNGSMIAYAWFVWDNSYKGETELGWILHDGGNNHKYKVGDTSNNCTLDNVW